jgi:hypothetical protein
MPGYHSTLFSTDVSGSAVSGTTEASLLPTNWKQIIAGGYLQQPKQKYMRIHCAGRISNIATTPGTLTLRVKLGPTANIAALTSRAIPLNTTVKTTVGWTLMFSFRVETIGAVTAATLFPGSCNFTSESVLSAPAGVANDVTWMDSPVAGTGFDSSIANQFDLTAQFSLTGNSMTMHTFALDDLHTMP